MLWILVLVLFMLVLAGGPYTGWHTYGWTPSGVVGLILVILIVLVVLGRI